jgi:hypothetical protein
LEQIKEMPNDPRVRAPVGVVILADVLVDGVGHAIE